MKNFHLYCLLFVWLLSSCNRGVFITIDDKKYDFGKNTVVTFRNEKGTTPGFGFGIKSFKNSMVDSSFFLIDVGRNNIPITAGDYSTTQNDRINFSASSISFYDNKRDRYESGGDEVYGTTFIITSLNNRRAKGWFKGKLVDAKADTANPSNTLFVEGRFNVSIKNAQHF